MGKVIYSAIELCSTVENIHKLLTLAVGRSYTVRWPSGMLVCWWGCGGSG